jgi:methionyl-tRNA formyltransferase
MGESEMRLLMMGTGPFAVPTFQWLLDGQHDVAALVTRPVPEPVGRRKTPANPMRNLAVAQGVPVLDPPDVNALDARQQMAALGADLLVACDYGQILSAEALTVTAKGGINLHGSLLPEYRGAAPIQWAILDGKQQTGVTVIHMTPRLDGGPCLVQLTTPIGEDEEAIALEQRLARLGIDAVRQALPMLESWDGVSPIGVPQSRARATKAPRLRKQDGWVDWSRSAKQIRDQVRALKPWPTTFTDWLRPEGAPVRLILEYVRVVEAEATDGTTAGQIVQVQKEQVLVATGQHLLSLEQVQPAGKRVMTIGEFLRGHSMQAGQLLGAAEPRAN